MNENIGVGIFGRPKVDEERWKVNLVSINYYNTYTLENKENNTRYWLHNIIGLEQVSDDEFLVYKRITEDEFSLTRYKLENNEFTVLFKARFSRLEFISEDRILFTCWGNTGPYYLKGIYSIKENAMLKEADWLHGIAVDVTYTTDKKKVLLFTDNLFSSIRRKCKLVFVLDPETLKPLSKCYSQIRDQFIEVSSVEEIKQIKEEDEKAVRDLERQYAAKEKTELEEARQILLLNNNNKDNEKKHNLRKYYE